MSNKNEINSTELTPVTGYAALTTNNTLNEALADDCAGMDFQLDRIKIPAGGSTAFEVPGEESGETEMAKDITGVILYNHPAYSYYTDKYTGGSNPPDCGSFDGVHGCGTPGGLCEKCEFNAFGSGEGKSKACKNRRMLYILKEGELFPMMLSLPTGSLKEYTNYVKRLLSKGKRLNQVVTKITLRKATNSGGIAFSQAVFSMVRLLDTAELSGVSVMTEQMKNYAANLSTAMLSFAEDAPLVDTETGEVIEPLK